MSWRRALVTGASAGIGAAIAERLAGEGTELIVVARGADRLAATADRLAARHGVPVTAVPADLCRPADLDGLADRIAAVPPDLLVNNAGVGSVGAFAELSAEDALQQIRLNVDAVVRLTAAALPPMLRAGHGHVLTVASLAGVLPAPGMAVYGATKAFVISFSESLYEELRGSGVAVTAVLPGYVRTEFQARAGREHFAAVPAGAWTSADAVARHALAAARGGAARAVPGRGYRIAGALIPFVPRALLRRAAARAAPGRPRRPG